VKKEMAGDGVTIEPVEVRDGKIVPLAVIRNQPAEYDRAGD
jgi:hypothetical protein